MANDNREVQQNAMAEQTGAATDETTGKMRKTPYHNAYQSVIDLIDLTPGQDSEEQPGMIQKYLADEPEGDERTAVINALSFLRDKLVAMRDTPADPSTVVGRHYVGILGDGNRSHFKSASVPSEKSAQYASFKIVLGPFSTAGGAEYCVNKGRKSADLCVFHRTGTPKDLGARSDYATAVNS